VDSSTNSTCSTAEKEIVQMAEILRKVQNNVRDRVNALNLIVEGAEKDVSSFIDHLLKLEPAQAVTDFGKAKGEGVLNFVEKQAEITRRWLGEA
jgi:hypothetical protein